MRRSLSGSNRRRGTVIRYGRSTALSRALGAPAFLASRVVAPTLVSTCMPTPRRSSALLARRARAALPAIPLTPIASRADLHSLAAPRTVEHPKSLDRPPSTARDLRAGGFGDILRRGSPTGVPHEAQVCLFLRRAWASRFPGGGHGLPDHDHCLQALIVIQRTLRCAVRGSMETRSNSR